MLTPFVTAQNVIDTDNDGLSDIEETTLYHTNPKNSDTDGDGFTDDLELRNGYSPRHAGAVKLIDVDSDNDGLNDYLEIKLGTDLLNPDTDGDGFKDGGEVHTGFDPLITGDARSKNKYVIVDLSDQHLHYFIGDVRIGSIAVSTGQRITPTPTGEFSIERKVPSIHYFGSGYSYPNTKWNLQFKPHYYLHGAYWHNQFGKKPMSHGCINIAYKDVEKLYAFLDVGDKVSVIGTTPAQAIR
jgi:lipoprotein-anchoring transpeptidase ErfK/SrfK